MRKLLATEKTANINCYASRLARSFDTDCVSRDAIRPPIVIPHFILRLSTMSLWINDRSRDFQKRARMFDEKSLRGGFA